ncbi:hypothetical protein, partial [Microcoleus sp.]|uniref:hypothetical protein n=1 Tax=Microcoleus sp. TaxID=44472 RepID=UPI00403EF0E7
FRAGGTPTPQDFDFFLTYNLNAATAYIPSEILDSYLYSATPQIHISKVSAIATTKVSCFERKEAP